MEEEYCFSTSLREKVFSRCLWRKGEQERSENQKSFVRIQSQTDRDQNS